MSCFNLLGNRGETLVGVSGKWASRAESGGSDHMGRWSWIDMRGEKGKMIRMVSAYRVSQCNTKYAGETTSCEQQMRSQQKRGMLNQIPKRYPFRILGYFYMPGRIKGNRMKWS